MRFLILIVFSFPISCSTKEDLDKDIYYVIKPADTVKVVRVFDTTEPKPGDPPTLQPPPPPPPTMFYGHHNFVLLDSRIFYHDNYLWHRCGTGIDWTKPPRLFLTSDSLTEIKLTDLEDFLKSNIPDSTTKGDLTTANISSSTDTIKNQAFEIITSYFKSKNITHYGIRNWTEEEKFALTSKIENKKYDPKITKYKIGFDENEFRFDSLEIYRE